MGRQLQALQQKDVVAAAVVVVLVAVAATNDAVVSTSCDADDVLTVTLRLIGYMS